MICNHAMLEGKVLVKNAFLFFLESLDGRDKSAMALNEICKKVRFFIEKVVIDSFFQNCHKKLAGSTI